jgi:hypothetical protein
MGAGEHSLDLEVERAPELLPWVDLDGWDVITTLVVCVEQLHPGAEALAAFLASGRLRGVRELVVFAWAPLPPAAIDAIAALPALEGLWLAIDCVFDPQVERLAAAPGLARLRRLVLTVTRPLSVDAFRALAGATFRPGLEGLSCSQPAFDDASLAALLAAPWPSLRRLGLQDTALGAEGEARLSALAGERGVEVTRTAAKAPGGPAAPTHAELGASIVACLRGAPSRQRFQRAFELLAGYDDARYEAELRAPCEAVLAAWPARERCYQLFASAREWRRPYTALARTLRLWVSWAEARWVLTNAPMAVERLELAIEQGEWLEGVDLATYFPALEALELGRTRDVAWRAVGGLRLPPTLRELDFEPCGPIFEGESGPATFRQALRSAAPGLRRVRFAAARDADGERITDGAFGPRDPDGWHAWSEKGRRPDGRPRGGRSRFR